MNMRVLVVEDTDDTRELFRAMLENLGHEVIEATGGREALEKALKEQPDIILMDLMMPEVDGIQTIGALRMIAGLATIPVVAVTAQDPREVRARAFNAGVNAYLQKPIDLEMLAATLNQFAKTA